jgi:hypothetical protein
MTMQQKVNDFARWIITETFKGGIDEFDVQAKAEELGLLQEVKYDPELHGPNDVDAVKGDPWFVISPDFPE